MPDDIHAKRRRLQKMVETKLGTPTEGLNHIAVIVLDLERSVRFYSDVLGMTLTSVAPNRDEPRSTHANILLGQPCSPSSISPMSQTRRLRGSAG